MTRRSRKHGLAKLGTYARTAYLGASKLLWPTRRSKVVQMTIDGRELLVLANEDVGRQLVFLRRYEATDSQVIASAIRDSDICVDVGANTGYYTTLMASRLQSGQVHAFEPGSLNIHLLRASIALNNFDAVATTNQLALGDRDGVADFTETVDGAYSSLRPIGRKPSERTITVEVRTLDGYLSERDVPRVDILKVDVEGAEGLVIDGALELLGDRGRRPRLVLLELYEPMLEAFGSSISGVVATMAELGYRPALAAAGGGLQEIEPSEIRGYNVFFVA